MVDRHTILTECLALVLERRNYVPLVVPIPPDGGHEQVLRRLLDLNPDVLLVSADVGLDYDGAALIGPMVRAGTAVIAITEATDEVGWGHCLEQGASVVVPKTVSLAAVVSAVRRVSQGQRVMERLERERLIAVHRQHQVRRRDARERLRQLSPQEGEILRHLMSGRTVREIASVRSVSESTVRSQVKAILSKLDLASQIAAVAAARQAGWEPHRLPIAG